MSFFDTYKFWKCQKKPILSLFCLPTTGAHGGTNPKSNEQLAMSKGIKNQLLDAVL
jgi:hypothetical protein